MSARLRTVVAFALTAALALAIVGCTTSGSTPETGSTAPAAGASDSGGQALVEQKCTMCHPIDQVNSASYDAAGWEDLVTRMEQNGLVVTPEERQAILDYLVQRDAAK